MTKNKYIELKDDFIDNYKEYLCEESKEDLECADTAEKFIDILHKYMVFLKAKDIPTLEWVRKWFADELPLINQCGCFLDQNISLRDCELPSIVLFGSCRVSFACTKQHNTSILVRDNSDLHIMTFAAGIINVRLRGNGTAETLYKNKYSQVKIRKV